MGWKWLKPPPSSPEFVAEVIYVYACFHAAPWQFWKGLLRYRLTNGLLISIAERFGNADSVAKSGPDLAIQQATRNVAAAMFALIDDPQVYLGGMSFQWSILHGCWCKEGCGRDPFFRFEWTWFSSLAAIALQDSHNPFWCNFIRSFNMILRLKQRSRQVDVTDTVSLVESLGVTTKYTIDNGRKPWDAGHFPLPRRYLRALPEDQVARILEKHGL